MLALTSCAVVTESFKEIEGGSGPVVHREEFSNPTGRWSVDTSHLSIQGCLQMPALPPQQGRNVSAEKDKLHIIIMTQSVTSAI